jgi:Phage endonuclease I
VFSRKPRSHLRNAYRSGLEASLASALAAQGIDAKFESFKIPYEQPAKARNYTPDFLLPNGVIIETKGIFDTSDRQKMLFVKEQHPDLDIRMVFSNANAKIAKGSPTTYAVWCEKNGYKWAHKTPDPKWLTEAPCPRRTKALAELKAL